MPSTGGYFVSPRLDRLDRRLLDVVGRVEIGLADRKRNHLPSLGFEVARLLRHRDGRGWLNAREDVGEEGHGTGAFRLQEKLSGAAIVRRAACGNPAATSADRRPAAVGRGENGEKRPLEPVGRRSRPARAPASLSLLVQAPAAPSNPSIRILHRRPRLISHVSVIAQTLRITRTSIEQSETIVKANAAFPRRSSPLPRGPQRATGLF